MKKVVSILLVGLVVLSLLAGCSSNKKDDKDKIVLGTFSYESCEVSNRILEIIFEQGYGRDVELTAVETSSGMLGLERGDLSATSELWLDNRREWFEENDNKTVVSAHDTFSGKVEQGWYVPKYVVDDHPEIRSVEDLITYSTVFKVNGKNGQFFNAPSGWNSSIITGMRFEGYGLSNDYDLVDPGSGSGLDMLIASTYNNRTPFVTYYWEPTWILGAYNMVKLDEPEYDESLWNDENKYLCSYPEPIVKIIVNKEFYDDESNKEVVEVLNKYTIEASLMNSILSASQETDYNTSIIKTMKENDWWKSFVTEEACSKIMDYLEDQK